MPELPEMEAYRRMLDPRVRAAPVQKAGPAHVATLKTFEPPLAALDGRQLAGARRRGKHLLFPTEDGELVLHIHLMSAGRLAFLEANGKQPKQPAFKLVLADGGALVLTERGSKKRARVGLYDPEAIEAELAHLGPEALGIGQERLAAVLAAESAATPPASSRPARDRRDRARVVERDPPPRTPLAVRALDRARHR